MIGIDFAYPRIIMIDQIDEMVPLSKMNWEKIVKRMKERTMPDNMGMNTGFEGEDKPSSYPFRVRRPSEIDLERIILENMEADAILIYTTTHTSFATILYLSKRFLSAFNGSKPLVCGQALGTGWGLPVFNNPGGPGFGKWRCEFPRNIETLRKELAAARAYKNAITVRVEIL